MTPDQKVEFIDGEVVMHSPARNSHLIVTLNISRLLSVYVDLNKLGELRIEKCLCAFPRNDYEPDLVFFGPEKSAGLTPETMKFPVPDLIVEVLSPSTEARDRGVKFEDYALHGVAEYWIVDAEARTVEQYLLSGEIYKLELKSHSGHLVSRVIEGFRAPIKAFFESDANLAALRDLV
jgi:Uma2 family endonuclease